MDIQQAKYVLELARQCNFTRAANVLHISQPTLSMQITAIEKVLGVTLFKRTTRAVLLTESGRLFCDKAQPVVEAWEQLMSLMELYRDNRALSVRIGLTFRAHVNGILDQCLTFFEEHPDYYGTYIDVTKDEAITSLRTGNLDVAFLPLFADEDFEARLPDLKAVPLTYEQSCLLMSKNHPLAGRKSIAIKELQDQTIVIGEENLHEDRHLRQLEKELSVHPGKIIRANGLESTMNLICAGKGVTLGASSFAKAYDIAAVPLEPKRFSNLCCLYKKDAQNPAVPELKAFAAKAVKAAD